MYRYSSINVDVNMIIRGYSYPMYIHIDNEQDNNVFKDKVKLYIMYVSYVLYVRLISTLYVYNSGDLNLTKNCLPPVRN